MWMVSVKLYETIHVADVPSTLANLALHANHNSACLRVSDVASCVETRLVGLFVNDQCINFIKD